MNQKRKDKKGMKVLLSMICAVLFNCVTGVALAASVGLEPVAGALGMNAVAALVGAPSGVRAGVYKEIWTGEMIKALRGFLEGTWLDGIPDSSSLVDNDVIHLVDVGIDPDVLVNNTSYPIDVQDLPDGDKAIKLDKFQTKATPVTDDELHAISYDKMGRVKESHANAIHDTKLKKAAHSFCALKNTQTTPVLKTTGAKVTETGRLKMTVKDVLEMKRSMDQLGVPTDHRRLVLCPDHVNDLLESDQSFKEQYNISRGEGKVGRLYGFDIYEFANTPVYTSAGQKKLLTEKATTGEFNCSFAFYAKRVFKATGSMKMYYSAAETDPLSQRNLVNFRHYFIAMPKKEDAGVVMMSGHQA